MGIDFIIKYGETMEYCKSTWVDIKWQKIFKYIHFQPSLLFDNDPNYWTTEQLLIVKTNMEKLVSNTEWYAYEEKEDLECIISLRPDIEQLISLFNIYVESGAVLIIS